MKEYTQKEIVETATSFLCSACSEEDDDFLWVVFEAIRLQGENKALKDMKNE